MAESTPPKKAPADPPKAAAKKPAPAGSKPPASKPAAKPAAKKDAPAAAAEPRGGAAPATPAAPSEEVTVVDQPTPQKHAARAKPTLTRKQRERLGLRRILNARRPRFRRQQWYEYARLANTGWRRPRGVDSAMRRHFGYETKVVRVGFRGPADVRGLHPSGFEEVRVVTLADLARVDPKRQAARIAATIGRRKLALLYAEADKRGVRVLNRRQIK